MAGLPEEVTRRLWERHVFHRHTLQTTDGRPVSVLRPGILNQDGGPDYLDALIRVGSQLYRGDVEIHCTAAGWRAHGHHTDPHYNRVILHVVGAPLRRTVSARTQSGRVVPCVVLTDPPSATPSAPPLSPRRVDPLEALRRRIRFARSPQHLLRRQGWKSVEGRILRLQLRLEQIVFEHRRSFLEPPIRYEGHPDEIPLPEGFSIRHDRASADAWDQLLYEGVMEGLGYTKNRWPFLALSRNVPLAVVRRFSSSDDIAALLFGAAGLLPPVRQVPGRQSRRYVRRLCARWHALRPTVCVPVLHEADWLFFRMRPANFPTARLACMAALLPELLSHARGFRAIVTVAAAPRLAPCLRMRMLRDLFRCRLRSYWRHHLHFRREPSARGASLGRDRITAVMLNSILPMIILCARTGNDLLLERRARAMMRLLPSGQRDSEMRRILQVLRAEGVERLSGLEEHGARLLYRVASAPTVPGGRQARPGRRDYQKVTPIDTGM